MRPKKISLHAGVAMTPARIEFEDLAVECAPHVPWLVLSRRPGLSLLAAKGLLVHCAEQYLLRAGALLFRGFDVGGVADFQAFTRGFGHELLGYEFGSSPRSRIAAGVYSSTEYPAHQSIPLHNEQSYCLRWPMKLWFHCECVAASGGETPIADSRLVYARVPERIRDRWSERRLMYVRNYGSGLDIPWETVFNTSDRHIVEAYCREHDISCEWKGNGELRTRQVCQAVAQHPVSEEWVWFNQAHLFHVSGLASEVRESLLGLVAPEDLPRNVYYGDGSPLEESLLDEVRAALDSSRVVFPWHAGDILMVDNMLVAHGRAPFVGERSVVVAMAEAYKARRA